MTIMKLVWAILLLFVFCGISSNAVPTDSVTINKALDGTLLKYLEGLADSIPKDEKNDETSDRIEQLREALKEIAFFGLEKHEKEMEKGRTLSRDEDSKRNVSELITSKGYSCEEHTAQTVDGYLLSIQRVGPNSTTKAKFEKSIFNKTKPVVLLQHGLLDASSTWVINQADNSLGFMLADAGFDVWMSNSRGNTYSHSNVNIKDNRRKFWEFSWDEMAKYDLPATIDYITGVTNASQIYYVGHSQGSLIAFTGFSSNTTLASKIKQIFALAPISHAGHVKGPIRLAVPFHGVIYDFLNLIGYEEVLPSTSITRAVGRTVCSIAPLFCELVTFTFAGIDFYAYNRTRSDVFYSHFPAGTSLQDVNHWAQMIHSGDTQMYDYGWHDNKKHYGQHTAPIYNISTLDIPVSLFSGGRDWLADPKDVEKLRADINHTIVYDNTLDRFDHLDFVWGTTAKDRVYKEIILQIRKSEATNDNV
ncbi:lipase member J-like [Convolutriloba macropyga]|uniref:lipase member J-like n=1 Tax=Convolutriloba macropyga TaxID=536237 RepID=UPI003F51C90A